MSDLDLLVSRATSAGAARVYKPNTVPPKPEYPYMVLTLDTGTPTSTRVDGRSPGMVYRLVTQMFSLTDDGMRAVATAADAAFNGVVLTDLDDDPYCYRELAVSPNPPGRDSDSGGVLYTLHTYRL